MASSVTGAALRVQCITTTEPGFTPARTCSATASGSFAKASPLTTSHWTAVTLAVDRARSAGSS